MKKIVFSLILVSFFILPACAQDGVFSAQFPGISIKEWLNIPKPPGAVFIFCLIVSLLATYFFPKATLESCCVIKRVFWSSLFKGLTVAFALGLLGKVVSFVSIASPLFYLVFGFLQLSILIGLAVAVRLTGILCLQNLLSSAWTAKHPQISAALQALLGSVVMTFICLIPAPGHLPLVGTRLVVLLGLLGLGGLISALKSREPN